MRAGEVVQIRINPKDCMSVVDVLDKSGAFIPGMSFPQAVSLAFSALLESVRGAGIIPERDGFEFSQLMGRFADRQRSGRKLQITKSITMQGSSFKAGALMQTSPELQRKQRRWQELCQRQEVDPENWTPEMESEHEQLYRELFPVE